MKCFLPEVFLFVSLTGAGSADGIKEDHAVTGHSHRDLLEVDAAQAPRIVELRVVPDPVGGVNTHMITSNFDFSPEFVNQEHVAGKVMWHQVQPALRTRLSPRRSLLRRTAHRSDLRRQRSSRAYFCRNEGDGGLDTCASLTRLKGFAQRHDGNGVRPASIYFHTVKL